jgi:glycosyltransferase involved in cell wall biosynthesis
MSGIDAMSKEQLRILYLRDTDKVCGPGKTILNTCRVLNKSKVALIVAATDVGGRGENVLLNQISETGIVTEPIEIGSNFHPRSLFRLIALIRKHRIKILQTHDAQTRRLGMLAAALTGIRHITSLHGWIQNTRKQRLSVQLDKFLIRHTDCVIVMSKLMKDELVAAGTDARKIHIIHNAIVLEDYPRAYHSTKIRDEFGIAREDTVIAVVGRLSAEKGHEVFLESARQIVDAYQKVCFLIVGDGPLLTTVRRKIDTLGLSDKCVLIGHRTDMLDVYASIDILAISSFTEGLPNVLLEAFALGKPVVSTEVGGVTEVLEDGVNGFIVSPGDAQTLADRLLRLLQNPKLAASMGRHGRSTIEQRFSFASRTERLMALYETFSE